MTSTVNPLLCTSPSMAVGSDGDGEGDGDGDDDKYSQDILGNTKCTYVSLAAYLFLSRNAEGILTFCITLYLLPPVYLKCRPVQENSHIFPYFFYWRASFGPKINKVLKCAEGVDWS